MEIQRKIVESKNPPSNKEVWWFDSNTEILNRYVGGKWTPVVISSTEPEPDLSVKLNTGDPSTLWVWVNYSVVDDDNFFNDLVKRLSDETDYQCEELPGNGTYYGIEVRTYTSYMTEDDVASFMEAMMSVFNSQTADDGQLPDCWDITVVLPPSISTLRSDMFNLQIYWDSNLLTIVTDSVKTINSILDEYASAEQIAITLICGMSTPPQLNIDSFGSESAISHTVNVPKGTMSRYTEDTNWNILNDSSILDISELPEEVTLDDILNRVKE